MLKKNIIIIKGMNKKRRSKGSTGFPPSEFFCFCIINSALTLIFLFDDIDYNSMGLLFQSLFCLDHRLIQSFNS